MNTECVDSPDAYMKIIYRCDGGKERSRLTGRKTCQTTAVTTDNPQTPSPPTCPTQHGNIFNNDVPLERAEITLSCLPIGGDRRQRTKRQAGGQKPCIFIHNVRAACKSGQAIAGHVKLVSLDINTGLWARVISDPYLAFTILRP